jgi:serine/threonine-protein kinase HipA
MEEQIGNSWYETTRRHGVSEEDCETISSAFLYPGFRLENVE